MVLYPTVRKRFNTRRKKSDPIKMSPTNHKNPLTQIDMNFIYSMILVTSNGRGIMNVISECYDMIIR